MKIKLHKLAKTTPTLREEIRKSELSGPQLAKKHGLSVEQYISGRDEKM